MSQKYSNQTLLSLKVGDVVYIEAFSEEIPKSSMVIGETFEDCITGIVTFDNDDDVEYGELYSEDFDKVYHIEFTK